MSLTGLVRLLVDQFLPDTHQHYLFENYRQMDIYRLPANTVPAYLKGRPRNLIKHCLVRKTKSNKFTKESVKHTNGSPGIFDIFKESGDKHTVKFGTKHGDEIPSCTCKDWARWHIPCKHFFAVFREVPNWSWESLPTKYLNSAYLTTDNTALVDYFTNKGVPQDDLSFFLGKSKESSVSDINETSENPGSSHNDQSLCADYEYVVDEGHHDQDHEYVADEDICIEIPSRSHETSVSDTMLKARVTLQNLKTLTYNFPAEDIQLAKEFTEKLDGIYHSFYSRLPSETGLILLTQSQEALRSTRRREHLHQKTEYANLPPKKKFKKSIDSRVGIKADRLKKESKVSYSIVSGYIILYNYSVIETYT